jgi:glutaredoxin
MSVTLYALDGCPYCEEVMATLDEHKVEYAVEWVPERYSERTAVREVSEQRSVPVLVDDEHSVVMANAARIQDYVRTTLA